MKARLKHNKIKWFTLSLQTSTNKIHSTNIILQIYLDNPSQIPTSSQLFFKVQHV